MKNDGMLSVTFEKMALVISKRIVPKSQTYSATFAIY